MRRSNAARNRASIRMAVQSKGDPRVKLPSGVAFVGQKTIKASLWMRFFYNFVPVVHTGRPFHRLMHRLAWHGFAKKHGFVVAAYSRENKSVTWWPK